MVTAALPTVPVPFRACAAARRVGDTLRTLRRPDLPRNLALVPAFPRTRWNEQSAVS
jgi:hypothetical protein